MKGHSREDRFSRGMYVSSPGYTSRPAKEDSIIPDAIPHIPSMSISRLFGTPAVLALALYIDLFRLQATSTEISAMLRT